MAIRSRRVVKRVAGKGLAWGCVITLGAALVSCAAPSYSYIAASGSHTYFKVPYGWKQISPTQMCDTLANGGSTSACLSHWLTAYEADSKPAPGDLGSPTLARPFAFAEVISYNAAVSGPLTDDTLRDFHLPVTASARSSWETQNGRKLTGFKQLRDSTISLSGGFHGVWETFDFGYQGVETNTYDQIALTDSAGDTLYYLEVHCTATCYSQDQTAINDVVSSFTVRSH